MSYLNSSFTSIIGILFIIFGAIIFLFYAPGPKLQTFGILFVILGALLGAVGAVFFYKDSSNQQDSLRLKSEEIANLYKSIAELNEQIAGSVTGGDSFCYLFPSHSYAKLNTIEFYIHHKGEFPVYDIFIRVWDESCLERIDHGHLYEKYHGYRTKIVTKEEWQKMKEDPDFHRKDIEMEKEVQKLMRNCLIFQDKIGTVTPNTGTNIFDPSLVSCTIPKGVDLSKYSQEYVVNIATRNGQYNQKIKIDIINKRWHVYSKVEKVLSDSQRIVVREYESATDTDGLLIKFIK